MSPFMLATAFDALQTVLFRAYPDLESNLHLLSAEFFNDCLRIGRRLS